MDVWLAIASKREVRSYADRRVPAEVERRILEAGRVTGSSQNKQARRFIVVADPETREQLAHTVYVSGNVQGAALVIVIVASGKGPTAFDVGRAAQNMTLVAWGEGVGSCPNGIADQDAISELLGLGEEERPVIVLTFGYPARPSDPQRRSADEWAASADRKAIDELVERL